MTSPLLTPCIQPNPDIAGIGVRVAIYAQAFLSFFLFVVFSVDGQITPKEDRVIREIIENNELMACALLVSALVQAWTYGLSVYHANIVLVLSWITFVPALAIADYSDLQTEPHRDQPVRFGTTWRAILREFFVWIHCLTVAGLGIWVWSDVRSFGDQRECTPQTFVVIFGHNVLVTNQKLKVFALLLYGFIALGATEWLVYVPLEWYKRRHTPQESPSGVDLGLLRAFFATIGSKLSWASFIFTISIEILLVASTEVLVRRSRGFVLPGESQWTFGQSLAVMLVISPLVRTIEDTHKGIRELHTSWKSRRRIVGEENTPVSAPPSP